MSEAERRAREIVEQWREPIQEYRLQIYDDTWKKLIANIAAALDEQAQEIARLTSERNDARDLLPVVQDLRQQLADAKRETDTLDTQARELLDEARRQVTNLNAQLVEVDAVVAGHWQGHRVDGSQWHLEDQARPVREAIERHVHRAKAADLGEEEGA